MLAPAAADDEDEDVHRSPRKNRAEDRGWKIEDRYHPSSICD